MIPLSKPYIGELEKQAVMEVLESGMLVQGPRTAQLEERFAALCGTRYAVATSSGTTALHLALLAHGIGPGDEVITTPFTFMASVNSILYVGATPVFVDIDPHSFNIDANLIERAVTPRTKAILPVHLFGNPCDMDALMTIADRHGLLVIEDAAQAVGADYGGRAVGSWGTAAFSLYATKNIMSGEGGMITTNSATIADRCRLLRSHGSRQRNDPDMLGYNFRMSDLHAAIGLAQLARLADFTARRRANARYLSANLKSVITPQEQPGRGHVWHQYTVRLERGSQAADIGRDAALQALTRAGIETGVFYPVPANKHAHLREAGVAAAGLPVAEQMAETVFSLPVHPQLSETDLETIVREVNRLGPDRSAPPEHAHFEPLFRRS